VAQYLPTRSDSRQRPETHLAASLLASLVATTVCNPADVIKTRVMNDSGKLGGSRQMLRHVLLAEGPQALMKGWCASYGRLGPHTIISFMCIEKIRKLLGAGTY